MREGYGGASLARDEEERDVHWEMHCDWRNRRFAKLKMKNEKVLEEGGDHEMEEPRNALKGQQQLAQGSALGEENGSKLTPYRGIRITTRVCCGFETIESFCTYSASYLARPSPRAMPWAMSRLALRAALCLRLMSKLPNSQTPKLPRPMNYELVSLPRKNREIRDK